MDTEKYYALKSIKHASIQFCLSGGDPLSKFLFLGSRCSFKKVKVILIRVDKKPQYSIPMHRFMEVLDEIIGILNVVRLRKGEK